MGILELVAIEERVGGVAAIASLLHVGLRVRQSDLIEITESSRASAAPTTQQARKRSGDRIAPDREDAFWREFRVELYVKPYRDPRRATIGTSRPGCGLRQSTGLLRTAPGAVVDDRAFSHSADVLAAIDGGRKIEAIKRLREETGLGLKEAKDAIDALARERQGRPA